MKKKYFPKKYFAYKFDYFFHGFKNQIGQRTEKQTDYQFCGPTEVEAIV